MPVTAEGTIALLDAERPFDFRSFYLPADAASAAPELHAN